jgi:hypothetical protein
MKKIILLGLIISLIISCTTQEKKSSIEGAWQLVYGKWSASEGTFPMQIQGSDIKIWSKEYFSFVGQLKLDTVLLDNFGGGTYSLDGNRYQENVIYHVNKNAVGSQPKMLLEIRNDSLIQKYPTNDNWELAGEYNIEIYKRLK